MNISQSEPGLATTTDGYDFCVNRNKPSFLVFTAIPSIPIFINVSVLVAVAMNNRNLLRQSRVYAHVSSTLFANVIFSILALIQILSLYFNLEGHDIDSIYKGRVRKDMVKLWAFRKAFLYGMYIIMCGNIGFLIEVIRSRINISLRSAAGAVRIHDKKSNSRSYRSSVRDTAVPSSRVARRRRSYAAIALLWVASLIYVIIPTMGWSCADHCSCLSSCFPQNRITDPPVSGCSRAFPPMSNSWLAVIIGVWAIGLLAVLIHLKRSIASLRIAFMEHTRKSSDAQPSDNSQPEGDDQSKNAIAMEEKNSQSISNDDLNPYNSMSNSSSGWTVKNLLICSRTTRNNKRNWRGIKPEDQFRHVVMLTVTYALCTAPPMIYLVADMALPKMEMNMILMNVCLLCPFIYCIISPILLIRCLPGLQISMRRLVLTICKCSFSQVPRRQPSIGND